jgi:hypothetical protein
MALTEFAFALPVLLTLGLGGLETANYAMAHLRVSNIAMLTADNAARVRDGIDEGDINEIFTGAKMAGDRIDFAPNGRIILSSMVRNEDDGQFFNWQRCDGAKEAESAYPTALTNEEGTAFLGVGPAANRIAATEGNAVMVVEVFYDYQPLLLSSFLVGQEIHYESAFSVRQRNNQTLTNIGNLPASDRRTCDKFEA